MRCMQVAKHASAGGPLLSHLVWCNGVVAVARPARLQRRSLLQQQRVCQVRPKHVKTLSQHRLLLLLLLLLRSDAAAFPRGRLYFYSCCLMVVCAEAVSMLLCCCWWWRQESILQALCEPSGIKEHAVLPAVVIRVCWLTSHGMLRQLTTCNGCAQVFCSAKHSAWLGGAFMRAEHAPPEACSVNMMVRKIATSTHHVNRVGVYTWRMVTAKNVASCNAQQRQSRCTQQLAATAALGSAAGWTQQAR
jgi:hypothetical protein